MYLLVASVHKGHAALFSLLPNGPCQIASCFRELDYWAAPGNAELLLSLNMILLAPC